MDLIQEFLNREPDSNKDTELPGARFKDSGTTVHQIFLPPYQEDGYIVETTGLCKPASFLSLSRMIVLRILDIFPLAC